MSLALEAECPATVEVNHSGIIFKNGYTPRFIELLCRLYNGALKQIINGCSIKGDFAPEGFVDTVLRPGLRQCLKLGINRVTPLLTVIGHNSLKLFISKAKLLPYSRKAGTV
ncbi:hypothetical protein ES703_111189 [subsurface metagenome]